MLSLMARYLLQLANTSQAVSLYISLLPIRRHVKSTHYLLKKLFFVDKRNNSKVIKYVHKYLHDYSLLLRGSYNLNFNTDMQDAINIYVKIVKVAGFFLAA
jgi:hypothetical protein